MRAKKVGLMFLALVLMVVMPLAVLASTVDVAVVDVTAPTGAVTLAPGQSGAITINMTVTGNQEGTATFEVYRDWTLSGGVFVGSNPQEFTVAPRTAQAPATTFSATGTVTVAAVQAAGTFTLTVGVFDITNSNATGAKLEARYSSSYVVTVEAPAVVLDTTPPFITCPPAVTVSANADCEAVGVSLVSPSVSDDQDRNPAVTNDAPGVFPLGQTLVTWTATDASDNSATCTQMVTVVDDMAPTIECAADVQVANDAGQQYATVTLEAPEADDNCSIASVTNDAPPTFPMGTTLVTWTATDGAGFTATCTQKVTVSYAFDGFFRPVEMSALNKAKAGSAIPIKFSLGSNVGLSIFEAGYPKSVGIQCGATGGAGDVIETVNAGGSSLSYDAEANQYVYVWKTDKSWVGTCRQFTIMLNDGTPHTANFTFTK